MRKYLALTAAALLLLVGCTSGDDGEAASPSEDTAPEDAAPTGPAPGVTDDAVKVGVTYVDLEAIREVTEITHGDYEAAYRALIDDLNERGGVHGRLIEPVFAPVNPIGTEAAEGACVKLAQDEDVFVVVGFFQADTVLCLVEAQETAVIGGAMSPDRLARATAPWFTSEPGADTDADAIRTLAEEGLLDGKLGVVGINQAEITIRNEVEPLLEELDVEALEVAIVDAPEDDVAATNAAVQVIAERFRAAGVEKVLVYGEAGIVWGNGSASLDYRPQLLFTGVNSIQGYAVDDSKDVGFLGGSIAAAQWTPAGKEFHESTQACIGIIEERTGADIPSPAEVEAQDLGDLHVAPLAACRHVALLEALLEAAGDDLNYGTFRQAGEQLGEIELPGFPDPFTYGAPPSADGDMPLYVYDWNAARRQFDIRS